MSEVSTEPAGDLVEAVAKSIATAFGSPWDWFSPQGQEAARTEARAAIAAMPGRAVLVAEVEALQANVARLRDALAAYDATVKACPANKTFLGDKLCPKRKAGPDEGCREEIRATMPIIEAARAAIKGTRS